MTDNVDKFADVYLENDPVQTVVHRSDLAVYEDSLINGQYVGRGWNGAGYIKSKGYVPNRIDPTEHATPEAFRLEIDDQFLNSHWDLIDVNRTEEERGIHVNVELAHQVRPVTVHVHTLLDGTSVLIRWLEVINEADEPATLGEAIPWSGVLQSTSDWDDHVSQKSDIYSVGSMEGDHWGYEGSFEWHDLSTTRTHIDGRYRRDRHKHPMFVLRNDITGEHFVGQLAWSGGFSFEFDLQIGAEGAANLSFGAGVDAPSPMRVIEPEESVETPKVHLGMVIGDLDETIQTMHEHLRTTVLHPRTEKDGNDAWVRLGLSPSYEMTLDDVYACIDEAAELGADVYWIDAGWYASPDDDDGQPEWYETVGDWEVAEGRFPEGMAPIRERVKDEGMLFGLWMDVERVGEKSRVAQEHPEWLATPYDEESDLGGMLDLANPTVVEWVEDQIATTIDDYNLDFFRLDYNVGNIGSGGQHKREDYVENDYWRYYENVYDMYARLRERFPGVIFENCASGGARTDIGLVQHFDHTWVTDWMRAPRSFMITNGMTMALPPEYVDRNIAIHQGHTTAELDFQTRLMLFGKPSMGMLSPQDAEDNPIQRDRIKHAIDIYKDFVQPFIQDSRIYHHTPAFSGPEPEDWGVLELAATDGSKTLAGVFQLSSNESSEYTLRFRGLDAGQRYRVVRDNSDQEFEIDGFTLLNDGVTVRLEAPLTSELLLVESV